MHFTRFAILSSESVTSFCPICAETELRKPSQTVSASGARYANADQSFVFWNKGQTAFIEENGKQTYSGCVVTP